MMLVSLNLLFLSFCEYAALMHGELSLKQSNDILK
jgi:hypothetical protein